MNRHNKILSSGNHLNAVVSSYTVNKPQSSNPFPPLQSVRILDQARERVRYLHYSIRTEEATLYWIRFFIRWSGTRHPREVCAAEVESFLTRDEVARAQDCGSRCDQSAGPDVERR